MAEIADKEREALYAQARAIARNRLEFARARHEAEAAGRLYRTEYDMSTHMVTLHVLTPEEVAEIMARRAAWAPKRALIEAETMHGERFMDRMQRELLIHGLPEGHVLRVKAEEVEAAVVALGIRKGA